MSASLIILPPVWQWGQEMASDPLELEVQAALDKSHQTWALATKPKSLPVWGF